MKTFGERIACTLVRVIDNPSKGGGKKWVGFETERTGFWDDSCGSDEIAEKVALEAREDLAKMIDDALDFDRYQQRSFKLACYPGAGTGNIIYPALGLAGETGEVCEKIKKFIRDRGGVLDLNTQLALRRELGDVLWYLSALSRELGLSLSEVAIENLNKLEDRHDRGVLHGSGDNR